MTVPGGGRASSGLRGTVQPLAALFDVALLDLDGVVYVGPHAVPHAATSLDGARAQHGLRAAFVTNNASRPPGVVAQHLRELGIAAADTDVVTSAQAGARVVAEHLPPGARVLAVGGPGVADALRARGFEPVMSASEDPAAVLQGYGPQVGWRELAEACLAIEAGALWVATNLDRTIPSPRGRVLGNGALVAAVQHATGATPVSAGKPLPPLMVESVERSHSARPLVVGDRLDTDIEGANACDIPSLLVLTGVTRWRDVLAVPHRLRPTFLDQDLRGLLVAQPEVVLRREGSILRASCRSARVSVPLLPQPGQGRAIDGAGWVPPGLPDGPDLNASDLDAVRAVIACSWALADDEPSTAAPGAGH